MSPKILLLSIRPKYAKKIFNGTKKFELRRVKPNLSEGDIVLVYVSSPIKQIWGTFEVGGVIKKTLDDLWSIVYHDAAISKSEFDEYFFGLSYGYGIFIKNQRISIPPIDLSVIRKQWEGFSPPQSYRYLSLREFNLFYSYSI